jgi:heparin/heparan-sulfate lyase
MKFTEKCAPVATNTPERLARLEYIKGAIGEFQTEDFGTPETGCVLTADFGKAPKGGKPEAYPKKGAHPRVLFNEADIPFIAEAVEKKSDSPAVKRFKEYLSVDIDGKLGEAHKQWRGWINLDLKLISAIQAQALAYAVWGDEYYGYSAIYAMKNYLLTLDIDYIFSDQCREFGMVMYMTACVYDWCYPLLTEEDKIQLATGVEHRLCRGHVKNTKNGILPSSSTVKMEMGFPPAKQSGLVGHGAEYQLQRDFLAMSIAVYDEFPSWYEFVGGRFYNEYAPGRRLYYAAGLSPQGMSYGPWRFGGDCYGAALIQAATGVSPYDEGMARVIMTFVSNETSNLGMFQTGDCGPTMLPTALISDAAMMVSHVLYDTEYAPLLRLISEQMLPADAFERIDVNTVFCAEGVIFNSRAVKELSGDWREHLPEICYNGGYVGQYISRSEWGKNAAVTMMRVGEMGTANHDHEDAGTFQIHYKGLKCGKTGSYNTYGSPEWGYYFQATISKNGLLLFDPKRAASEPIYKLDENGKPEVNYFGNYQFLNAADIFYSGGQRTNRLEPQSLAIWKSGRYNRARVMGHAHAYREDGRPLYSYIAGDITNAYSAYQAYFVGRSMLTVFTEDEKHPMLFFCFDKANLQNGRIIKKFLLQIEGEEAPIIDQDAKTVKIESADGQLVLQSVAGVGKIEGIGGGDGKNSVINGVSCQDKLVQNFWGRVELSNPENPHEDMLNVIYVSNRGESDFLEAQRVAGVTDDGSAILKGATIGGCTALFASAIERTWYTAKFTAQGEGEMTYYVAGLLAGEWTVSYGDVKTTVEVGEESGLLTFNAPAGVEITVSM